MHVLSIPLEQMVFQKRSPQPSHRLFEAMHGSVQCSAVGAFTVDHHWKHMVNEDIPPTVYTDPIGSSRTYRLSVQLALPP